VSSIFIHPSELLYIVIDNNASIRIFDVPTMSLIGKTYAKVEEGYIAYRCMFDKADVGLFYILYHKC